MVEKPVDGRGPAEEVGAAEDAAGPEAEGRSLADGKESLAERLRVRISEPVALAEGRAADPEASTLPVGDAVG